MKTALITGGARGIGLATAHIFAANGHQVVSLDRDAQALDAAALDLPAAEILVFDVSNPQASGQIAQEIQTRLGDLIALSTMLVWLILVRLKIAIQPFGARLWIRIWMVCFTSAKP